MIKKHFILILSLLLGSVALEAKELPYEQLYTALLQRHVIVGKKNKIISTLVDYKKLNESQNKETLFRLVEEIDIDDFTTPEEAKAFWINAYNIGAIRLILDHSLSKSIMELNLPGSPIWNIPVFLINEELYNLAEIKNHLLGFKDPRIHFALNPGVLSAPDLRREAYTAEKLEAQLNDQIATFSANTTKGANPETKTQTLFISPVFREYSEDKKDFKGIQRLINPHTPIDVSFYELKDLPFDWSLNRL